MVHPDPRAADAAAGELRQGSLTVVHAPDGRSALGQLQQSPPDLVLLALDLGADRGTDVLREIRAHSEVPVIVTSTRLGHAEGVLALELGADDYVQLPLSRRELLARVRTVLRRTRGPGTVAVLEHGDLRIDRTARQATLAGRPIALTSREYDLLVFLAAAPRKVFSRAQLLQHVWQSHPDWQDDATVTEHVSRLRRKIEVDPRAPRWIVTVRSFGYRFEPQAPGAARANPSRVEEVLA